MKPDSICNLIRQKPKYVQQGLQAVDKAVSGQLAIKTAIYYKPNTENVKTVRQI